VKFKVLCTLALCLFSASSIAEDYATVLKNSPTNHFQLLLNNLNILSISRIEEKSAVPNDLEKPQQKLVKFFESQDGRLVANGFYEAPVSLVTSSECKKLVDEARADLVGDDSKLAQMLRMVSYFDMTRSQSLGIAQSALIVVTLQAVENRELSVSCSG